MIEAERARRIREDTNGQTLVGVKKLKGMLQVQIPAKYAIPAFVALLGGGGYAYKDALVPAAVSRAWVQMVETHIAKADAGYRVMDEHGKAIAGMQGEVRANREETIANRAAIQELTRSVDRLTDRLDKLYPLLAEKNAR